MKLASTQHIKILYDLKNQTATRAVDGRAYDPESRLEAQ